jgi:hypothetical protein
MYAYKSCTERPTYQDYSNLISSLSDESNLELKFYGHPDTLLTSKEQTWPGLPDFCWYNIPKRGNYTTNMTQNTPTGHNIFELVIKIPNCYKMQRNFYTLLFPKIGTFCMHLASGNPELDDNGYVFHCFPISTWFLSDLTALTIKILLIWSWWSLLMTNLLG